MLILSNKFYFCRMKMVFLKQVGSLLLSLLFIYNAMGYLIAYKSGQYFIRQEMKTTLCSKASNNQLKLIKISLLEKNSQNSAIQFVNKKEVKYYGKLYDIVREKITGDSITYYCLNDKKEEKLMKDFFLHVENQIASSNLPFSHKYPNILKSIVKDFIPILYTENNMFCTSESIFFEHPIKKQNFFPGIPSPPPKLYPAIS